MTIAAFQGMKTTPTTMKLHVTSIIKSSKFHLAWYYVLERDSNNLSSQSILYRTRITLVTFFLNVENSYFALLCSDHDSQWSKARIPDRSGQIKEQDVWVDIKS